MDLTIDNEFKARLRPLEKIEYEILLKSMIAYGGARDPIIAWGNTILDGHHRWEIIQQHNLRDPEIIQMTFKSRNSAVKWIDENQAARRNDTEFVKRLEMGREQIRAKVMRGGRRQNSGRKKNQTVTGDGLKKISKNSRKNLKTTSRKIAEKNGVSEATVDRAAKLADAYDNKLSRTIRRQIESQKMVLTDAQIKNLATFAPSKQNEMARQVRAGRGTWREVLVSNQPVNKEQTSKTPVSRDNYKASARDALGKLVRALANIKVRGRTLQDKHDKALKAILKDIE